MSVINEDDLELVKRRDELVKKYRADAIRRKKKNKRKNSVGEDLGEQRTGLSALMDELEKENGQ